MSRSRSAAVALVLAAGALAACEKKTQPQAPVDLPPPSAVTPPEGSGPGTAPATEAAPASGSSPADASHGRAAAPIDVTVPDAEPLNGTTARMLLIAPLEQGTLDGELADAALDYLIRLGEKESANEYARKLLVKGPDTGGYEDIDTAAIGLAALVRTGDRDGVERSLALAKAVAGDATVTAPEGLLRALKAIGGAQAAEARKLLAQFAQDDVVRGVAFAALAETRSREALDFAETVARDAEDTPFARGAAVAALLAAGDARAGDAGDALATTTVDAALGSEAIDGLAVPGLVEALPVVRAIVEKPVKEDNAAVELRSAGQAYVSIRGVGKGTAEDFAYLRSLLGKDDGDADAEVRTALWLLGDDKEVAAAAKRLADVVKFRDGGSDDEPGVDVLEGIAARRAGAKPPFDKLVNAAAAVAARKVPKHPGVVDDPARLRIAAAFAFLSSQK